MTDKHAGGRPPKYTNPDDMQVMIDRYFDDCHVHRMIMNSLKVKGETLEEYKDREFITDDEHPTITGMALVLDLTRQSLLDYQNSVQDSVKDGEYLDTIKKGKARVEAYAEQRMFMNNPTGTIFSLKNNFNWKDKQDIEYVNPVTIRIAPKDADLL